MSFASTPNLQIAEINNVTLNKKERPEIDLIKFYLPS